MSASEREQRRQAIRIRERDLADERAATLERSRTCLRETPQWHVTCIGNTDPDRCLCECHDDAPSVVVPTGEETSNG